MRPGTDYRLRPLRAIDAASIRDVMDTTTWVFVVAVTSAATGLILGLSALAVTANDMPMWLLGRASGITSYLLLSAVTAMGLILSHNTRARHRPKPSRIRLHLALVIFTFAFIALHIVVLAIDPYAKVGWAGALLPMGAAYRPVPVTMGLISVWSALISGASAGLAGRGAGRIWLYLHRFAALSWVLAWAHGVLTGIDTKALMGMYAGTGVMILTLAVWRYLSREKLVIDAQRDRQAVRVR